VTAALSPVEILAPEGARVLEIAWSDGSRSVVAHRVLRGFCPCAVCQGHQGPVQWVDGTDALAPAALELVDLFEVGSYALGLAWGDGHRTGIYRFNFLRVLADAAFGADDVTTLYFER
jgi:DUF971 family protein